MAKRSLTDNEQKVLYGLVHHPTRNDRELSEALRIKVSTVTAIRRRLRASDYFVTRRIPMMHRLGWEILVAGHGRLAQTVSPHASARMREILEDRLPTIFHVSMSPDHFTFLAMAPDYTTFRRDLNELRTGMHRAGLSDSGTLTTAVFPVGLSVLGNFFDYSHVLALAFGFEDRLAVALHPGKVGDIELSRKETDVLRGLVRFPELSDKAVAGKIRASRQAVSKMRRGFEADGLLRSVRIPNVRALGFELVVSTFAHFTPPATVKARADVIEKALRVTPAFFFASCDMESVLLAAIKSYEHFSSLRSLLGKYYEERGFLAGDATIHIGLASMTDILRNADFSPAIQTLPGPTAR